MVQPTLKLLSQILTNEGAVNDETNEGGPARCHMRLRATLCMLKFAHVREFDKALHPYFEQVAYGMQDPNFGVRSGILKKLHKVLPPQHLPPKWNVLPVLFALDPEQENVTTARGVLAAVVKQAGQIGSTEARIDRIEMPLARLLFILSRHPDLSWSSERDLKDVARFIDMFIDCVAHRDNVSLLYTIASKMKTVSVVDEVMDEVKLGLILDDKVGELDEGESPTLVSGGWGIC